MFDIKNTPLPDYTRKEDIVNSITHAAGVPLCIAGTVMLYKVLSENGADKMQLFACGLYLASTLLVFLGSAIYHGMKPGYAKRVARILDHCNIYVMISGNVTAFYLNHLYSKKPGLSIGVIIAVWALSAIGMLLTFMDLKKFNVPQIFMYNALGWAGIFAMKSIASASTAGKEYINTVLIGGAFITLGAVLYFIGKKFRYFHAVFHVFVLIGSVFFFLATYNFALAG